MQQNTIRNLFIIACSAFLTVNVIAQPSTSQNYVIANTVKQAGIYTESAVNNLPVATQGKVQTITYFDGLGRPLQTVVTNGSASQKDIVTGIEYDQYGREVKKYLPFADIVNLGTSGSYRPVWKTSQSSFYNGSLQGVDADSAPYIQAVLEPSPLDRVLAQGAPGTVWQPNMSNPYDNTVHAMQLHYLVNKALDSVRIFNVDTLGNISSPGFYGDGLLTVKLTADEQNNKVKEFTDKNGHVILKRVYLTSDSLQTYYIYNDLELLSAVIQPEGSANFLSDSTWTPTTTFIKKWMFLYRYDQRNRMVMKKVPGADSVLMVYDQWDRVVLTQDGNLRKLTTNNWLFTKYDQLNRPIVNGFYTDTRTQSAIRADVASQTVRYELLNTNTSTGYSLNNSFPSSSTYTLTINTTTHYDSYANIPASWASNYTYLNEYSIASQNNYLLGQVIATQSNVMGTSNFMRSVSYFDDKYRVVQSSEDNAAGGIDRISRILSFEGKTLNDYHNHTSRFFTSPILIQQAYTYDHVDRLLQVTHQTGSQEAVTITQNSYNELGQLLNKKLHQSPSHPNYLQKLDYSYNIRGWLTAINNPDVTSSSFDESDLLNVTYHYNTTLVYGAYPQYNGNISDEVWKGGYDEYLKGNRYVYDAANRMDTCFYGWINSNHSPSWTFTFKYNEYLLYDHSGNITYLHRTHGDWNEINDLHYAYYGNHVTNIQDWRSKAFPMGFQDKTNPSGAPDYFYDASGNLYSDYNKRIDSIKYNFLNLPTLIAFNSKGTIAYTYDASGNKLQKTVTDQTVSPAKVTNFYYAGDFEYRNDTLEFISHAEGRLRPVRIDTTQAISISNLKYIYDYFLRDNLNNTRAVLTTEQETDLYAATMEANTATIENQLFSNISSTVTAKPGGFDTDNNNAQVSRLNGEINTTGNSRVGPAIVLKVMVGDTVSISTYAWYQGATQPPPTDVTSPIINDLLPLLTNGMIADGATHQGMFSQTMISNDDNTALSSFLSGTQATAYNTSKPKAFLNWMVVDEEFNAVKSINHQGAVQVPLITGSMQKQQLVGPASMVVRRNGYLYVYLSNESNQDVYFDNLVINHKRGPLVEQKEYYSFGEDIWGLNSQAVKLGYDQNRKKFNDGNEHQAGEFLDGTSYDMYDAVHRQYDPEIGSFRQVDELGEVALGWSPYTFGSDNPVCHNDPLGLEDTIHTRTLPTVVVHGSHTQQNLKNTYWYYINNNISFDQIQDKGLRNWMYRFDANQQWLHNLHLQQKEQEQEWVEYASWLVPVPAFGELKLMSKLGQGAIKLFRLKRGLQIAEVGVEKTSQYLYHYTSKEAAESIKVQGLKVSKDGIAYLTNTAELSPIQAQIELALPANRALPNAIIQIDATSLKADLIRRVTGNLQGLGAGGGTEYLFSKDIPANLIKIIK